MGATADSLQLDDFESVDLIGDDPGAHALVPKGMEQAAHFLASSLLPAIRTNTPVKCIDYSRPSGVVLQLADGSDIEADFTIVTCSLGALKEGLIQFRPALPTPKAQAIERSTMGQYMKVLVEFPLVFWPSDAQFFGQLAPSGSTSTSRMEFPLTFNYFKAKGAPVLETVIFGDDALCASELTDDEIVDAFRQHLSRLFGMEVPAPVGHFITRWNKDEFARGAYSCLGVDSSTDDPELLRQTVANRVLFAGEATNYRYQGALQAAYLSGLAAVGELEQLVSASQITN
ncbi:hypothetical protein PINS_up004007 [Pythium insidiosum]|nr:hypothetical protein PINS_up004007 [Pythium insidiosum]